MNTARRFAPLIAFLLLAAGCALAISASAKNAARDAARKAALINYQSQLAACKRGNILRHEINRRVGETDVTRSVVVGFLHSAESARRSAYLHEGHHPTDAQAAAAYAALAERENKLRYHTVPVVNCLTVIKLP